MSLFDKKFFRIVKRIYYPLGLIVILIILLSVLSFSPSETSEINSKINILGGFGYSIASSLFYWFGYAFYFLVLFFISFFIFTFPKAFRILSIDQIIGEILLLFSFTILLSIYNSTAGGYIGNTLSSVIEYMLGKVGVYIILLLMIVSSIASIIKFNLFSVNTYKILINQFKNFSEWIKRKINNENEDNSVTTNVNTNIKKESLFNNHNHFKDYKNQNTIKNIITSENINNNTLREEYLFQQDYDDIDIQNKNMINEIMENEKLSNFNSINNENMNNGVDFYFLNLIKNKRVDISYNESNNTTDKDFNFIKNIINKKTTNCKSLFKNIQNDVNTVKSISISENGNESNNVNTSVITKDDNIGKNILDNELYLNDGIKYDIDKELNIKLENDNNENDNNLNNTFENTIKSNISVKDDSYDLSDIESKSKLEVNKQSNINHSTLEDEEYIINNNIETDIKSDNIENNDNISDIFFEEAFSEDKESYSNHTDLKDNFKHFRVSKFKKEDSKEEIDILIKKLEKTLNEFKIEAKVTGVSKGPVITRYEIHPAPGIKLSKIVSLADNISLSLGGVKIRIIAPIPGKSAVGIEVPNKNRDMVRLGDIFIAEDFKTNDSHLPVVLGRDISGKLRIADLVHMPHLLVAGSTNSGKSVCINSIICSLLYAKGHDDVKFILVDPKIVELKVYNDLPNLLTPVITEPKKASLALKWLVKEMLRRYKLLESYSSRNIMNYNKKINKLEQHNMDSDEKLNYIVLIIDEFADLMMVAKKEVEESISRLAAMARAVGIHLILATQRPSTDVITGTIKSNFPARIGFMVSSYYDSKTILDNPGAEKLLGKGDMLFFTPGMGSPERIQGTYVSEEEIIKMMDNLKKLGKPNYIESIFDEDDENSSNNYDEDFDEPLWEEAVNIVINEKKASASYLQRKLKIGYNRAARIVEHMEYEGIVGPEQGSKPRDVLIDDY